MIMKVGSLLPQDVQPGADTTPVSAANPADPLPFIDLTVSSGIIP